MKHACMRVALPSLLLAATLFVGCGSDSGKKTSSDSSACKAGTTTPCNCPSGMTAIRRCNDTGTAYGVCICGGNTTATVGQPTAGAPFVGAAGAPAAGSGGTR